MSATDSDREEREEREEERRSDLEPEERDGGSDSVDRDLEKRDSEKRDSEERDGGRDSDEQRPSSPDELECKICYQRYSAHGRRPKLLGCLHRVCARCLRRMLDLGSAPDCVSCPFCRHETPLGQLNVAALPDDANLMGRLARRDTHTSWSSEHREVLLTPDGLAAFQSPAHEPSQDTCLVITIMEVQRDSLPGRHGDALSTSSSEGSLDSASLGSAGGRADREQDGLSKLCAHVPRVLVWLLGCFYFGSLPLGIYLLVIQRVTLGIVCVSLVPTSLTVCLVYGFCQCLCQGLCDCSPRT